MKHIILGCLFLGIFLTSSATESPAGFWGIEFGSSREEVKKTMSLKKEMKLALDFGDSITYTGGSWSGENIAMLFFTFYNDMMISATISLKPVSKQYVLVLFDEMVEKLNTKYHRTKKITRRYNPPFAAGDGYELLAIEEGYATISARWKFDDAEIRTYVSADLTVLVHYENKKGVQLWKNQLGKKRPKEAEINDL